MARKQGCGCLPFVLGALLLAVAWGTQDAVIPPLQVEQFDPRSPRRPMPQWGDEQFVIEDRLGGPADSMGTAFAVDRDGAWLTAEHVYLPFAGANGRVGTVLGGMDVLDDDNRLCDKPREYEAILDWRK